MSRPVALVTGASGGIGKAIAAELVQAGWQVYGTSRNAAGARPIPGVTFLSLDLADEQSITECVQRVLSEAGSIDALISNAGLLGPAGAAEELSLEQIRAVFETNLFGVIALTNAVLQGMIERGGGRLVYISSTGGRVAAIPLFTAYTASKHALEAYAAGLRREVSEFGLRVTLIEPGYTQTGMMETVEPPAHPNPRYLPRRANLLALERYGLAHGTPPARVAHAVLKTMKQDHPPLHVPVGSDSRWMIALERLLPNRLLELLLHWMFFRWNPGALDQPVPSTRQLGMRAVLFHSPTRDRLIRFGWAAVVVSALGGLLARLRR